MQRRFARFRHGKRRETLSFEMSLGRSTGDASQSQNSDVRSVDPHAASSRLPRENRAPNADEELGRSSPMRSSQN